MKLTLILTKQFPDEDLSRIYGPGQVFEVEVQGLTISSKDDHIDGMTLDNEDLKSFRLLGETSESIISN